MTAINHRLRFFLWEIWETFYRLVNNGEERDSLVECKKWSLCSQSAMPNWNKWPTLRRGQKVPMRPLQKYLFGRGAGVTVCYCRSQYDQCKKYSCRGWATTLMREIFGIESSRRKKRRQTEKPWENVKEREITVRIWRKTHFSLCKVD